MVESILAVCECVAKRGTFKRAECVFVFGVACLCVLVFIRNKTFSLSVQKWLSARVCVCVYLNYGESGQNIRYNIYIYLIQARVRHGGAPPERLQPFEGAPELKGWS